MRRTKIYAPSASPSTGLLVQRAAAAPAPKPATPAPAPTRKPLPTVGLSETNHSAEFVAAAVVPHGKPPTAGRVELVGPGGTFSPPSGADLRGFIHRDGSAIKFAGAAGGSTWMLMKRGQSSVPWLGRPRLCSSRTRPHNNLPSPQRAFRERKRRNRLPPPRPPRPFRTPCRPARADRFRNPRDLD